MKRNKKEDLNFEQVGAEIIEAPLEDFISDNYLLYSYYVIQNRALISDDGLKPVNRRILHSMYERGITPNRPFVKAASVAGNVMSDYHPHGNVSIEDALARMAQGYNMRVPLIDFHGNVGENAGDPPAAARYWEAKLSPAAVELIREVKHDTVDMVKNYDGTKLEPVVLPTRWPNGIINGSQGIAVGYACNIFPHNPDEVINAAVALLKNPELTTDELMEIMPGPDFPSGGELVGLEGVKEYFETGRGTFTVRGRYKVEPIARGAHLITFYELPFQVSAEDVIKAIKAAKGKGHLKGISEMKDLSDIDSGLVFTVKVKAGASPTQVLKELMRYTPVEQKFSSNMTVLHEGRPQLLGMKDLIAQFLELRKSVVSNKLKSQLESLEKNISRLSGLIKVIVDIDKAIEIIRKSDSSEIASSKLQKSFKITAEQAEYVLSMQLRKLTKADKLELETEIKNDKEELESISKILKETDKFIEYLEADLLSTLNVISDERRTVIHDISAEELAMEAKQINKEIKASGKNVKTYITLLENGKVVRGDEPFAQKRAQVPVRQTLQSNSQDALIVIMKDGTFNRVPTYYVPENRTSNANIIGFNFNHIAGLGKADFESNDHGILIVTKSGEVNIVNGGFPNADTFTGVKLEPTDEVVFATQLTVDDLNRKLVLVSSDGYGTSFGIDEIRTSNAGAGTIRGMLADGDIIGASIVDAIGEDATEDDILVTIANNSLKVTLLSELPERKRASKGVIIHRLKDDTLITAHAGTGGVIAYNANKSIRLPDATTRATAGEEREGNGFVLGYK